jgi:hypothetical protein
MTPSIVRETAELYGDLAISSMQDGTDERFVYDCARQAAGYGEAWLCWAKERVAQMKAEGLW